MLEINFEQFAFDLDEAEQAHLEWSRRLLRCAVLHTSPGDDVMENEAHTLCHFGRWLTENCLVLEALDTDRARYLKTVHQSMHDAIRNLCSGILKGNQGAATDLDLFEVTQSQLVGLLSHFKTLAITRNSQIDSLTRLPLRHRIKQDFDLLTKFSRRHNSVVGVIILDIDHFKDINDKHGHNGGDIVLQHLATILKKTLRESDQAYRYGGEEFLLLMELSAVDTEAAAQRVLEAVRDSHIILPDDEVVRLTLTMGIALTIEDEALESVVHRADMAMYKGKELGRNCYLIAEEPSQSFN